MLSRKVAVGSVGCGTLETRRQTAAPPLAIRLIIKTKIGNLPYIAVNGVFRHNSVPFSFWSLMLGKGVESPMVYVARRGVGHQKQVA